jgi:ankyrin repeat protein
MSKALPARPNLDYLRKLAKRRLKQLRAKDPATRLATAQLTIARDYGFASWRKMQAHVSLLLEAGADTSLRDFENKTAGDLGVQHKHTQVSELLGSGTVDLVEVFLKLAVPDPSGDHKAGSLGPAADLLKTHPELGTASIHTACVTGRIADLKRLLASNKSLANEVGGPWNWPPLCYLTFSRFLRGHAKSGARFVRCAKLLLAAGADPNSYFPSPDHPEERETALYGAAGIANNAALTRLLLEAGADPNDHESLYHASEFIDNSALRALLAAKLNPDWISYCMCHKMDMEDPAGLSLFIKAGADVNRLIDGGQMKGWRPLHFALFRGRSPKVIELLLNAGADPTLPAANGTTAYKLARRLGRLASAELMLEHGAFEDLTDVENFLAALSAGDRRTARRMMTADNTVADKIIADDYKLLVDAAAAGNLAAVRLMLDHQFPIETKGGTGGGWDGTALHHSAWHGRTAVVRLLLDRGANVLAKHGFGGNAMGAAIHGASHAGHRNGVAIVKLIASELNDAALREHLEGAKTEPNVFVVKALEKIIHDRERRLKLLG